MTTGRLEWFLASQAKVSSPLSVPAGTGTQQSWVPPMMFILGATVFAAIWSRFFRRGPGTPPQAATKPAKHIR